MVDLAFFRFDNWSLPLRLRATNHLQNPVWRQFNQRQRIDFWNNRHFITFSFVFCFQIRNQHHRSSHLRALFPLHLKFRKYLWTEIETAEVRKYKPLLEYGGYGIRGFGKNRALNISGNTGFQLVFKDGRKLLIGTQKGHEMIEMLNSRPLKK